MNVHSISFVQPDWRVGNEEISEWCGLKASFINDKIGVESRAFLRGSETGRGLAKRACDELFARNPSLDSDSIRLLLFVTQTPDYPLPHSSALLQDDIGLSTATACFDVNLGCSGYVYGLTIAKSMMVAEGMDAALVVTCDPYSKIMARDNRDVVALFGDGATATLLTPNGAGSIGRGDYGTDGGGAKNLILKGRGGADPRANLDGTPVSENENADQFLHMSGRAIFNFMMTCVPKSIDRCLEKNAIDIESIDYFVFHQASRFLLETLADSLELPREKVIIDLADKGNTVSSTIPMVLSGMLERGELSGKTIMVSGFGVGLSWATNVIRFGER